MYERSNEDVFKDVVGKRVLGVFADGGSAVLTLDDGNDLHLDLDGDCCSHSYFQDEKQFDELKGAVIQSIEERDGVSRDELYGQENGAESVDWSFLVFVTDRGHVTIDWRNDSNGYYSGWCDASLRPTRN